MLIKSIWKALYRQHERCGRCRRLPSMMTQIIYTEHRVWCFECYRTYILGEPPMMAYRR